MSEQILIAIDNGYGQTKGVHCCFPSGVEEVSVSPPIATNTIEYEGKHYIYGISQTTVKKSKTCDEHTFVASLAVIAKELELRGSRVADIRIGAGTPLTWFGTEKKELEEYFLRDRKLSFKCDGKLYSINIISVDIFPQGYAAVVDRLGRFGPSTVVIDAGSWTEEILPILDGKPDLSRCKSIPIGTITAINEINENLRQRFGGEADEAIIRDVMIHGTSNIDSGYLNVIQEGLRKYVAMIFDSLRALKFNTLLTEFVFVGGGATVIKNFATEITDKMTFIEDININAKGYEGLLRAKYGRH